MHYRLGCVNDARTTPSLYTPVCPGHEDMMFDGVKRPFEVPRQAQLGRKKHLERRGSRIAGRMSYLYSIQTYHKKGERTRERAIEYSQRGKRANDGRGGKE